MALPADPRKTPSEQIATDARNFLRHLSVTRVEQDLGKQNFGLLNRTLSYPLLTTSYRLITICARDWPYDRSPTLF